MEQIIEPRNIHTQYGQLIFGKGEKNSLEKGHSIIMYNKGTTMDKKIYRQGLHIKKKKNKKWIIDLDINTKV